MAFIIDGEEYASTSTILKPLVDKHHFKQRYKKQRGWLTQEPVPRHLNIRSTERGKIIHNLAKSFLHGDSLGKIRKGIDPFWQNLQPMLEYVDNGSAWWLEGPQKAEHNFLRSGPHVSIWHPEKKFSTIPDCCARVGGVPSILEYKTCIRATDFNLDLAKLQVASYASAIGALLDEPVKAACILLATPRKGQWFTLEGDDLTDAINAFHKLVDSHYRREAKRAKRQGAPKACTGKVFA